MSDKVKRSMWLFLVVLFVVTTIGVSIYAFWQNTHSSSSNIKTKSSVAASCQFSSTSSEALAAPEIFKPSSAVTALQTTDLQKGNGQTAKAGDCLVIKYYGTLAKDGTVFDQNYTDTAAIVFPIGIGYVIPGWEKGIPGMQVGGIRRLVVPASEGYKDQQVGTIPPNSDLVFVVKLESIKQ